MVIDVKKEGKVTIITLNRPEALNSISMAAARELSDAIIAFRDDPDAWVGIITGAGEKAFSAGADIRETLPFMREHKAEPWAFPLSVWRGIELWKPLIAAVNGIALGGGLELALACDIRIAAEHARFGAPEVTLGILPGFGATQRLPRAIPWCKAAEMLLMGKPIDAQEAYRIGLINKVVPAADLMKTAKEWAEVICAASPLAVRASKEAMYRGYDTTLAEGLRLESALMARVFDSTDSIEGTTAFVEKRKPQFKGK